MAAPTVAVEPEKVTKALFESIVARFEDLKARKEKFDTEADEGVAHARKFVTSLMAFDGRRGASLPQASSMLNPSPRPPKTSIKARYEVQEIVQEAATRRPLSRLRTNLRHQNPAGRSAPKAEREEPQPIELGPTRAHQLLGVPSVHLGKK